MRFARGQRPMFVLAAIVILVVGCTDSSRNSRPQAGSEWSASYTSAYEPPGNYGAGDGSGYAGQLTAVVAFSADDALAAGYTIHDPPVSHGEPVLLHWDGKSWSTWEHQPDVGTSYAINGMVASSVQDVWLWGTVRGERAEFEQVRHWDGDSWSIVTDRGLPFEWSAAVVLLGGKPWLVGADIEHGGAFIASYKAATASGAARWVAGRYARSGGFAAGVASADGEAWAVGGTGEPLARRNAPLIAHRLNGRWRVLSVPGVTGSLSAVAVAGPRDALAVGIDAQGIVHRTQSPLAMRYDGRRWREIEPPPTAKTLRAVAVAPDGYWAAGEDTSDGNHSVYYHLATDGTWTTVQGPKRDYGSGPDYTQVNQLVQLPGSSTAWGVGYHFADGCTSDSCVDDGNGALLIDEHS